MATSLAPGTTLYGLENLYSNFLPLASLNETTPLKVYSPGVEETNDL